METSLRVVVLDPNSDYVRLGETRSDADASEAERFAAVAGSVEVRSGASGPGRVSVRFRDLNPAQQAALLRLDPLADRESTRSCPPWSRTSAFAALPTWQAASDSLKLRARNLGVDRWQIWPHPGRVARDGARGSRRTALFGRRPLAGTRQAGRHRERGPRAALAPAAFREPIAIVIDEAHNVCPAEPTDLITALATEDAIRIAGEGRKRLGSI